MRIRALLAGLAILALSGCVTTQPPRVDVVARSTQELRPVHLVYLSRPPLPTSARVENARTANVEDLTRRITEVEAAFAGQAETELKRIFEAEGLFRSVTIENIAQLDMSGASISRYINGRRTSRGEDVLYIYPGASSLGCTQMGFGFLSCTASLRMNSVLHQGDPKRLVWGSVQTVAVAATAESAKDAWRTYWSVLSERMKAEGVVFAGNPPGS